MKSMSPEERRILVSSQIILQQEKEISQLFVDGILGKKFGRALSFYLDHAREYLDALEEMLLRYSRLEEGGEIWGEEVLVVNVLNKD